jgi:formiminoglutamase
MSTVLEHYTAQDLVQRTSKRAGEQRLGEVLAAVSSDEWESNTPLPYKFVIVGIEEDFGVRGNHGRGGTQHSFGAFLSYLCNFQSNRFFPADSVAVLGAIIATQQIEDGQLETLREATAQNDRVVKEVVERIAKRGAIPIVVGGGHNNAYGCLAGVSAAAERAVHCLNIDAHTDLRNLEGRHSGNGFTYALEQGALERYFMLGIQENYTPEHIWQRIEDNEMIDLASFEDLMSGEEQWDEVYVRIAEHLGDRYGLELDTDVIANFPSSAQSVSGFSFEEVRKMMYALDVRPDYFHICEGRVSNETEYALVGRGLALLVADFIKAHIHS